MKAFEALLIMLAVVCFAFISFKFAKPFFSQATKQNSENKVCFGNNCFSVEIAKTEPERDRGLMNRAQLEKGKGMLFIFEKEGIYPFWMKNTLIPLDMVWISENYKVVFVSQNVQPCKSLICPVISPDQKAKYVLEVNGGVLAEVGIKAGDTVQISISK